MCTSSANTHGTRILTIRPTSTTARHKSWFELSVQLVHLYEEEEVSIPQETAGHSFSMATNREKYASNGPRSRPKRGQVQSPPSSPTSRVNSRIYACRQLVLTLLFASGAWIVDGAGVCERVVGPDACKVERAVGRKVPYLLISAVTGERPVDGVAVSSAGRRRLVSPGADSSSALTGT